MMENKSQANQRVKLDAHIESKYLSDICYCPVLIVLISSMHACALYPSRQ